MERFEGKDPNQTVPDQTVQTYGHKRHRNRNILIAVAVVILIVAAALVGYFVTKNKNDSSSSSSPSSAGNATATASAGSSPSNLPNSSKKLFGYWGQNAIGNGVGPLGLGTRTIPNSDAQKSLKYYCDLGYYQTMNLAFFYKFGSGNAWGLDLASLGRYEVDENGGISANLDGTPISTDGFLKVGEDIKYCQSKGIKVVLSIGGDMHSPYTLVANDGLRIANILHNSFLGGSSPARPFGNVTLDGIESDIEKPVDNNEQLILLQTLKQLNPKLIIAAVPQCFLNGVDMDFNTGPLIKSNPDLFDYVIIQYYNNPTCSYPFGFNFPQWTKIFKGKLVIGLAGDDTSAITGGFLNPGQLQAVLDEVYNDPQFYGISVYDVSSSNPSPSLPSTYSQILRRALNGEKVGSGYPPQGAFTTEHQWAARCAGTWGYANETCGLPSCKDNWTCADPNQMCFMFLQQC
ncbi:hypothetical protein HDU79_000087 [Rhizoclosmatium sp. JEL0117]|nr:hypothetical protein HDU79_000087 [Rhizoclosmatium sp. JEL0117]